MRRKCVHAHRTTPGSVRLLVSKKEANVDAQKFFARLDFELSRYRREYGACMPFDEACAKLASDQDAMGEIVSDAAADPRFLAWLDQTVAKSWRVGLGAGDHMPQHVRDTLDASARRTLTRWGWTEPEQGGDE